MRSGNGRHRRPRQVPAIVVAAGVTGASLAMPLLAATGANAAEAETWDKVARCESGGVWSSNAGNGFFGGLQMTQEMWQQNGGTDYAPRPDLASRSQQIAVAERILASRGPDAWPSCAVSSGLAKGGKAPEVNPGSTHTPEPEAPAKPAPARDTPSTPATPSPDSSEKPDSSGKPSPSEKPSSPSSSPSPSSPDSSSSPSSPSAPTGTDEPSGKPTEPVPGESTQPTDGSSEGGKHRKPSTDDPTEIPSTTPGAPSGTPGTDTGSSGTPTPDGTDGTGTDKDHAGTPRSDDGRASRDGGARTDQPGVGDYTVRPGDNLSAIAEQHSVEGGWSSLYQDNKKVVGDDPDLIQPGQKLEVKKKAGK
ncbi:transglycosylase family protein [Streptomyces syringium]|uniref:transglycosylase family protein n=1 Tax=Streptomyces syringium TaxID=76729 RepID=UPI003413640B